MLVTFFASQSALGLLLDYGLPHVRFAETGQILRRFRGMQQSGESVDVVVLGSSRLMLGLSPDALTGQLRRATGENRLRVLNAAVAAGRPETASVVFDLLLEQGARPRFVLIDISPESIAERDDWMPFYIKRLWHWDELRALAGGNFRGRNLTALARTRLFPIFAYAPELRDALVDAFRQTPCPVGCKRPEDVDWTALARPPAAVSDDVAARLRGNNGFFPNPAEDYRVSASAVGALDRIISACRRRQITLLVIGPPFTARHRAGYSAAICDRYRDFTQGLNTREGVRFFDCHVIAPETLFHDGHHLSFDTGAVWFADYVARELLVPRWPQAAPGGTPREVTASRQK